jgi:hypothetical protein
MQPDTFLKFSPHHAWGSESQPACLLVLFLSFSHSLCHKIALRFRSVLTIQYFAHFESPWPDDSYLKPRYLVSSTPNQRHPGHRTYAAIVATRRVDICPAIWRCFSNEYSVTSSPSHEIREVASCIQRFSGSDSCHVTLLEPLACFTALSPISIS